MGTIKTGRKRRLDVQKEMYSERTSGLCTDGGGDYITTVVVDGFVIPKHQMHASIPTHQGKVHLKLLNCTITYQQNVYVSYVPSVQYSDRKFKDMWGN